MVPDAAVRRCVVRHGAVLRCVVPDAAVRRCVVRHGAAPRCVVPDAARCVARDGLVAPYAGEARLSAAQNAEPVLHAVADPHVLL